MTGRQRQQLAKIYEEFYEQIYGFIYRRVPLQADVEDIVAETFMAVGSTMDKIDTDKPYRPWVFAIARHKLNDFLRKKYRLEITHLDTEPAAKEEDNNKDLKLRKIVDELISELKPHEQEFIIKKYKENFTNKQLADHFKITLANAKTRNNRILKQLHNLWLKRYG